MQKFVTLLTIAAALMLTVSAASADIACGKVGTAYDQLFVDGNARIEAILAEFKALPGGATEAQKDGIRKKFCAVGGEIVGLYKFMAALANDCSKQGEKMGELLDVVNKQLDMAQGGVKICQ